MRRYKFMTLSEEIACYYEGNRVIVEFSNITLFLSQLCWLTVQIMGGAAVLGAVTGLPYKLCVVLAGFAKAVISIPGGLKAVVYTDVLQTIILFCGFGFLIHSALKRGRRAGRVAPGRPGRLFSFLGVASLGGWNVLSLILVLTLNPIADPGRRLTMYSAHSEAAAKWSMVTSGVAVIIFSVAIGITGMYTFRLNPHLPGGGPGAALAGDECAAALAGGLCGGGGGFGHVLCGQRQCRRRRHIFRAAHLSAGDRRVIPSAPWWSRGGPWCSRYLASTALALYMGNIVEFVRTFLPLTMSGLGVIILLGRFWKRSTWQGALAALITTPAVSLA